jgi:hypothetical protein
MTYHWNCPPSRRIARAFKAKSVGVNFLLFRYGFLSPPSPGACYEGNKVSGRGTAARRRIQFLHNSVKWFPLTTQSLFVKQGHRYPNKNSRAYYPTITSNLIFSNQTPDGIEFRIQEMEEKQYRRVKAVNPLGAYTEIPISPSLGRPTLWRSACPPPALAKHSRSILFPERG